MSLRALALASAAILLTLAACGGGSGGGGGGGSSSATMRPGENCLASGCHAGSTTTTVFTAAGTVYASGSAAADQGVGGVTVKITDVNHPVGSPITLTTNGAGNFYTSVPIDFPSASVSLQSGSSTMGMSFSGAGAGNAAGGGCASCHVAGGRVHVP